MIYSLVPLLLGALVIALQGLMVWGLVAMSAAGRTAAWYGMLTGLLLYILPEIVQLASIFLPMIRVMEQALVRAMEAGPPVFAVSFACYAGRLVLAARRAAALEAECTAMAAAIGGTGHPPTASATFLSAPGPR